MLKWKLKMFIDKIYYEEKSDVSNKKRILAYLIDWYIGGVFASLPILLLYQYFVKKEIVLATSLYILPNHLRILAGVLVLVLTFIYYFCLPMYVWKGQTLGKKLLNIKIVKDDYSEVDFRSLFLRQIVFMFLIEGKFIMPSTLLFELISILLNKDIVLICSSISYCLTFFSALAAFNLKSHKAFHDIFSHTKIMSVDSKIVKKAQKNILRKTKI